jgi:hypothetical protein
MRTYRRVENGTPGMYMPGVFLFETMTYGAKRHKS